MRPRAGALHAQHFPVRAACKLPEAVILATIKELTTYETGCPRRGLYDSA